MLYSVITTIQRPTESVLSLAERIAGNGHLVIAGDTKGPDSFDLSQVAGFATDQLTFLSIEAQLASDFRLADLLPTKHYCRKNVGYLHAIHAGASCIYETDDDNAPLESWQPRSQHLQSVSTLRSTGQTSPRWVNAYRHFTDQNIWPRGLPLDQIHAPLQLDSESVPNAEDSEAVWAPIQQGLADGAPDVDAIWRLVLDREFKFEANQPAMLPPGQWCPFNTQSTWWWPDVYPLMYVPSYCTFRMCDIWKSFIAQRCLWELGTGVVFHTAEVWQERNVHNLMRDFNDEVPGYQLNDRIASILEATTLQSGRDNVSDNLRRCYEALVGEEIFPEKELELLEAWIEGVRV